METRDFQEFIPIFALQIREIKVYLIEKRQYKSAGKEEGYE
ncbi:hypothetical protein [Clostridium aceticum]|nr:hypothetical protein [Clostridium aceticum]